MTILFLSPRFYPEIGGVEKHSFEVAKQLSKKHKVIVLTEGNKDRKDIIKGINVIRLSFGKNGWFKKFVIWKKILKYRKIVKKADLVHCHDVFFWYLPLRLIYPRKKVYITFHGYEGVYPPKMSAIFIRKLSEKLTDGNISIGKYIDKWYGTRAKCILYGASDNIKRYAKKRINKTKLKILFIGRIDKDTGVNIYTQVLVGLKNFDFKVCGDGPLKAEFEKFGKIYGFVNNLKNYIRKTDIIFSSSYLSIIESLSFNKPVFSVYDNPLKEDYLKLTPFSKWIYISKSPKDLSQKINVVVKKDKLREKNSESAYNWVKDQSWGKITKDYLGLWGI